MLFSPHPKEIDSDSIFHTISNVTNCNDIVLFLPGDIFRPIDSDVSVLIFASGKMVIAGIKSEALIETEIQTVLNELNLDLKNQE